MAERIAVITGGEGALAQHLTTSLQAEGFQVNAPARGELDVTCRSSVESYFKDLGSLDLLINNAGVLRDGALVRMEEPDWDGVIDSHLKGAFLCAKAAARPMARARSGHLLQISSFGGLSGTSGQANYAAAKSGLIGLTKSLALELGKRNVRANCVLPGFLDTGMGVAALEKSREEILERHSLGRLNTPEDAARFIVFLDSMTHVSGQVFNLDSRVGRWS